MKSIEGRSLKSNFSNHPSTEVSHSAQSLNFTNSPQSPNSADFFSCKDNFYSFISSKYLLIQRFSHPTFFSSCETREIDIRGE